MEQIDSEQTNSDREYYLKNRDKILKRNRDYREKHKDEQKIWARKYYELHKAERLEYAKNYRDAHRNEIQEYNDSHKEYSKVYRQTHKDITDSYREEHKDEIKEWNKNYHKEYYYALKLEVLSHYSQGTMICKRCGFSDVRALSIDHVEGGGSKHRRELSANFYRWLKKNGFPEGYQVLCMNCQAIKRAENSESTGSNTV